VSALSEKFYSIDATNYEEDVEKALSIRFTRSDFHARKVISAVEAMRIELAKLQCRIRRTLLDERRIIWILNLFMVGRFPY
jgi:hypothetical protein